MVNRAHDVRNYWLGGIVNAAHFPYLGVIGSEKSLVEVYHWVFFRSALTEVLKNSRHICLRKDLCQVINQPGDTFIEVVTRYVLEEFSQERVSLRQVFSGVKTGEG